MGVTELPLIADSAEPMLVAAAAHAHGGPHYVYAKRCFDVVVSVALLVILAPAMLLIAALILVESGRPVFHVQERVGARRRRESRSIRWQVRSFRMFKFRTMFRGAEASKIHEEFVRAFVAGDIGSNGDGGTRFKLGNDPRVTRVGRVLRATSLDELPQLFNVLAGTMSLIGPRPVPEYEVASYEERHWERLAALPGMSGTWQVEGRGRVSFEEMVRMDIEYVRRESLWLDVKLLVRTIPAVLTLRGAR